MKDLFREARIDLDADKESKFILFTSLIEHYNSLFNITAIRERREIIIKHFIDSAKGAYLFVDNSSVAEVGSGGGFPSVPLMIMNGSLKFTLIESTGKKCEFLKKVKEELGLDCEILNARAEEVGKDPLYREKFDYCTARAVARLNVLCEYCLPLVKKGGKFIAYKGAAEEEEIQSRKAVNLLGGKTENIIDYELPEGEGKRTLIVIGKERETPPLYPRGNGKERKHPL